MEEVHLDTRQEYTRCSKRMDIHEDEDGEKWRKKKRKKKKNSVCAFLMGKKSPCPMVNGWMRGSQWMGRSQDTVAIKDYTGKKEN